MDSQRELLLIAPLVPIAIVYIIGLVISATKLGLHRKAATLAMAGFACLLVGQLARIAGAAMTFPAFRGSASIRELSTRLTVMNLFATAIFLGGTILLLLAIFAGRDRAR